MLSTLWSPFGEALFGIWLFGWFPVKPPRWLTEGPAEDAIITNTGAARITYLFFLTMISLGPLIWIDTARLRRRLRVRDLALMVRVVLASRRGIKAFIWVAMVAAIDAWLLFQSVSIGSYAMRISLVLVCGVLLILLLPPTAIVLANSSPESGQLLVTATRRMHPFRVVSLLDGRYLAPTIFANSSDNLRTVSGDNWRTTVYRLVEITPLVIVDARFITPSVIDEIRHMTDLRRIHKAIFVVNDDGSAPGLEEAGLNTAQFPPKCCTAREVMEVIGKFKSTGLAGL